MRGNDLVLGDRYILVFAGGQRTVFIGDLFLT